MIDEETGQGSEQSSNQDLDSDVSVQEDNDEEIDTTKKEVEWIECIKRSTKEAEECMKKTKIVCWIENTQNNEMANCQKTSILIERKVTQQNLRLAFWF